ncbi:MAG: hypothetical protein ACK4SA_18765 [Caldilinea sp.]
MSQNLIPVGGESLLFLLLHALRHDQVFSTCLAHLQPGHLDQPQEVGLRHIWSGTLEYYQRQRRRPDSALGLWPIVSALIEQEASGEFVRQHAWGVVNWIYDREKNPDSALEPALAADTLRAVLYARAIGGDIKRTNDAMRVGGLVDYSGIIESLQRKHRELMVIGRQVQVDLVPEQWTTTTLERDPIGLPFFDTLTRGGSGPGRTNVLLGPTGVGKTLVLVQLGVYYARRQATLEQEGQTGKLAVIISYEANLEDLRARSIACGATINIERLRTMRGYHELSTASNPQPYERAIVLPGGENQFVMGERERLEQFRTWVNRFFIPIDFSSGEFSRGGTGGIQEVRQTLESIQQTYQRPIGFVALDWAGMAVRRQLRVRNNNRDDIVRMLSEYVQDVIDSVSGPLNCQVWCAHQLTAKANKRPPTVFPHHSEADWCGSFAQNAWLALTLGTKDIRHSACLFGATKTREGETQEAIVCRIRGEFNRLEPADTLLRADYATGRFVPRGEAARIRDELLGRGFRVSARGPGFASEMEDAEVFE